jgi:PAS domain S-box-containing protein
MIAELTDPQRILQDIFDGNNVLAAWYIWICWAAFLSWGINFILLAASKKRMPPITFDLIRPVFLLLLLVVATDAIRYLLNAYVTYASFYKARLVVYFIDAHLAVAITTLGVWYMFRKKDNIFDRLAAHKRNSDRFQSMTNSTRITGVIEFDSGCNIWYVNPAALRILGYGKLVGEKFTILLPTRDQPDLLHEIELFLATGTNKWLLSSPQPNEICGVKSDGTEFPLEITMSAYNLSGSWRFMCLLRDITYRKKLEEALPEATTDQIQREVSSGGTIT